MGDSKAKPSLFTLAPAAVFTISQPVRVKVGTSLPKECLGTDRNERAFHGITRLSSGYYEWGATSNRLVIEMRTHDGMSVPGDPVDHGTTGQGSG